MGERFLRLSEVAEVLDVSMSQVYALVRSGELRSIKIGGRGQYRVGRDDLEAYIASAYAKTEEFVRANPLGRSESLPADVD